MNSEHELKLIIDILNSKKYYVLNYEFFDYNKYFTLRQLIPFINKTKECREVLEIEGMTSLHINFKESYIFELLPNGFNYMSKIKELNKIMYFYNDNAFNLKNIEDIKIEINNNLKILKEWALNLPIRKEK